MGGGSNATQWEECNVVIKAMGFGVRQTCLWFYLIRPDQPAVWYWPDRLTSLSFSFLIYKIEVVIRPHRVLVRVSLANVCNMLTSINKAYYYYYPRVHFKKLPLNHPPTLSRPAQGTHKVLASFRWHSTWSSMGEAERQPKCLVVNRAQETIPE